MNKLDKTVLELKEEKYKQSKEIEKLIGYLEESRAKEVESEALADCERRNNEIIGL